MTGWHVRRRWMVVAAVTAVAVLGAVAIAWVRRTAAPWPAVAGTPYTIRLGPDGCPVVEDQRRFVDAPGPLVPPDPTEVLLCTTPTAQYSPSPGVPDEPRQRVLRAGTADFAALLDRLPDRNQAWRQWQRLHSGWWPDPAPMGEVCLLSGSVYDYSYVLRYPDRPPVPLISNCGTGGLTSGARTRVDNAQPHVLDEFLDRFQRQ